MTHECGTRSPMIVTSFPVQRSLSKLSHESHLVATNPSTMRDSVQYLWACLWLQLSAKQESFMVRGILQTVGNHRIGITNYYIHHKKNKTVKLTIFYVFAFFDVLEILHI